MTKVTVAVYGTLKRGHGNNRLLKDARFLGEAVSGSPYQMYCRGFPVILPGTGAEPGLPVAVELYEVTRKELARLDQLEGNGRYYQRSRRRFKFEGKSKRAWIYIGKYFNPEHMRKVTPTATGYTWPDMGHYSQRGA